MMISSVACFVRGDIEGEVSLTGANVISKKYNLEEFYGIAIIMQQASAQPL